ASDPDDVVAELAGVGPCHGDILPARPCWASQLRCHLFVQQTRSAWVMNKMGEDGDPALTVFQINNDGFDVQSFALL
ncbi:hypothetical protein M5F49_21480, partial [Mycobacteroides abscessus]|uniref:hypothetical protein n=1 Tax=Mycobacteroides abscessus TaxID=36809 RepID=UPI002FCBC6A3